MSTARAMTLVALLGCGAPARRPAPIENLAVAAPIEPPAPGACKDRVAGVWIARVWREDAFKWDEVTLTIERTGATTLGGRIVVTTWDGDADQLAPPRCPDGSPALTTVVQRARGAIDGAAVDLAGSDPVRTVLPCGAASAGTYNPDHFVGVLEPDGVHLDATNDDGSIDRGRPHRFERSGCGPISP